MAQSTTDRYSVPVVRNQPFSLFKSEADEGRQPKKGTPTMAASKTTRKPATTKTTGAARKAEQQARLAIVRPTEQQQEQQTVNTQQPTLPVTTYTTATLADLQAQKRAIIEQLKAAKASQPAKEPKPAKPAKTLHDVVERQAETVGIGHVLYIASRAQARVKMGQDPSQAVDAVAAREGDAAKGAIEYFQTSDYPTLRDALMAWCAVNAPATVVKQHVQVSDEGDTTGEQ